MSIFSRMTRSLSGWMGYGYRFLADWRDIASLLSEVASSLELDALNGWLSRHTRSVNALKVDHRVFGTTGSCRRLMNVPSAAATPPTVFRIRGGLT